MTNSEFIQFLAAIADPLERIAEYVIRDALAKDAQPDPTLEHQLALDLIRAAQDAQAKKDAPNP